MRYAASTARPHQPACCAAHGWTGLPHALLRSQDHVADIGYAAGFASEAVFHRQFRQAHALTPAAYRALGHSTHFTLSLPSAYRSEEVLAYLGRDAQGPAERRDGQQLCKAVLLDGEPFRLNLHLDGASAHCSVAGAQSPSAAQMRAAHHMALRCLGLSGQVAGFERSARQHPALAPLLARRPGLHFPLSATVFESLVWAIVGQQVNLAFAATLRRVVIELAGQPAGEGMLAHPSVAAVAALDPATLCTRQFSRSKAAYLVDTACYLLEHGIDIEQLPHWSFPAALRRLTAIRGIGPWTAQYTLLRGGGFADCVPVGDAGLNCRAAAPVPAERAPEGRGHPGPDGTVCPVAQPGHRPSVGQPERYAMTHYYDLIDSPVRPPCWPWSTQPAR